MKSVMFVLAQCIPLRNVLPTKPTQTNSLNKQTSCTTIPSLVTPTIPIGGTIPIFCGDQTRLNRTLAAKTTLGAKTTLETRTTQETNNLIVHHFSIHSSHHDSMSHLGHNPV